jgi:3-hydroxyisobutyrate dehydrogenase-like beta-hydroxyacid dehydrogenase
VPNFVGAPAELAEMCDYIQIFVSDDDALIEVVKQLAPALAPRHVVIAHSTVAPHSMLAAAEIVEHRGARFLEAPFTGSREAAENGQLVYYVGGDEAALREAQPILEASAKEVIFIGEVGQATAVKITTNMVTAASVQAAAEAMALVQTAGVPLEKFVAAMRENASNSKTLDLKLPKMIEGNFEPHFSVKHMLKDMQIASRMGLSQHLELGVTSAARDRLLEQMQRGHGDEDYSAIARKYFPDIRSASREEEDLELFEPRTPAPAPVADVDVADKNPIPVVAEPAPEDAETQDHFDVSHLVPAPAGTAVVDLPAEAPTEHAIDESASTPGTAETRQEPQEDSESRHSFLGRLLRRGANE